MAVFRVERNKNYTVMSNYHLRDKSLSLKAKGLLSQMLSLPDNWDYTLSGLSYINQEGKDAVRSTVNELERAGYVIRHQTTDASGKFSGNEYIIHEYPVNRDVDMKPAKNASEEPLPEKPTSDMPSSNSPLPENPTEIKKETGNKEERNTDVSITDSIPVRWEEETEKTITPEGAYLEVLRENIEYPVLLLDRPYEKEQIDEILEIMLDTVCSKRSNVRIAGDDIPVERVKARFMKLERKHMEYVLDCMRENSSEIRNIRQYLKAVLFNAPETIGNYYAAKVSHDFGSGSRNT